MHLTFRYLTREIFPAVKVCLHVTFFEPISIITTIIVYHCANGDGVNDVPIFSRLFWWQ